MATKDQWSPLHPGKGAAATPEEIAWAAGIYEGEGCVVPERGIVYISISMTDYDVLERWQAIMGGRLKGPYMYADRNKPRWELRIGGWAEIEEIYTKLKPWLSIRRTARFEEILAMPNRAKKRDRIVYGPPCGSDPTVASEKGYHRHLVKKEQPCETCVEARNLYARQLWKKNKNKRHQGKE
jgi:hypothetical protein